MTDEKEILSSEKEKLKRSKALMKELTVSKRNDMIQNSRSDLTLREQKAVLYMLAKIKPDDSIATEYEFSCLEFAMAIGITGHSKYNYKQIMNMLQKLSDKSWWIIEKKDAKENARLVRWFNTVHIDGNKKNAPGKIRIKFHEDMAPYIFNLARQKKENSIFFSTYNYKAVILMKNKYSPQLLEVLESYRRNNVEWYFDVKDLQELLADVDEAGVAHPPKRWKWFTNFENDVLRPAVMEINQYSDLNVDYVVQKRDIYGTVHRSAQRIIFFMNEKTPVEKMDTDLVIMEGMRDHMSDSARKKDLAAHKQDEQQYQQMKLDFENRHKENVLNEQHERTKSSKYPLLASLFPEFEEEQIQALYSAACVNYDGRYGSGADTCVMWTSAYINLYYDIVKGKNAGKDPYPLLLAYVSQDYNHFADKITV